MLKKAVFILLFFLSFFWLVKPVIAQEEGVNVYFFWSKTCPHCYQEKIFLEELKQKYEGVEIKSFEVTGSRENQQLLKKVGKELKINISGVPFTVIGEDYFVGFLDEVTTGQQIEATLKNALVNDSLDVIGDLINSPAKDALVINEAIPESIKLPLLGEIKTKNLSLPAFTFVIALLDGFNPCAMWVLIFLISLLLGMKDRRRMWLLGSTFIVASGMVYFLFMSAWLNLFLFLGFVLWVRILIGLFALGAGGYNLRDYYLYRGACKVAGGIKRAQIMEKMKKSTQESRLILALVGIIALAFAVNLIELVCSAGLPALYTQVLSLTKLPRWQYYFYLFFYILIFMLDDLVIFSIAMVTLKAVDGQNKYAAWSKLIGGLVMLLIGLLMLFKPEWLMFG